MIVKVDKLDVCGGLLKLFSENMHVYVCLIVFCLSLSVHTQTCTAKGCSLHE